MRANKGTNLRECDKCPCVILHMAKAINNLIRYVMYTKLSVITAVRRGKAARGTEMTSVNSICEQ
jgi:hypothetical protein